MSQEYVLRRLTQAAIQEGRETMNYSAEDVHAAWFASQVDRDQRVQFMGTPQGRVIELIAYECCDPRSNAAAYERTLAQYRARYLTGESVLKSVRVVATRRFRAQTAAGEAELAKLRDDHRLVSEAVLTEDGRFGAGAAYRYVALAEPGGEERN